MNKVSAKPNARKPRRRASIHRPSTNLGDKYNFQPVATQNQISCPSAEGVISVLPSTSATILSSDMRELVLNLSLLRLALLDKIGPKKQILVVVCDIYSSASNYKACCYIPRGAVQNDGSIGSWIPGLVILLPFITPNPPLTDASTKSLHSDQSRVCMLTYRWIVSLMAQCFPMTTIMSIFCEIISPCVWTSSNEIISSQLQMDGLHRTSRRRCTGVLSSSPSLEE